jgi:adenine phosphoribosyltransferase
MEVHEDAMATGENVLLVDDLIATGGTAVAALQLIGKLGALAVGASFVIDLPELGGADHLRAMGLNVEALCAFEGH